MGTKINSHAFSGGGALKADHFELGCNLDVDVPIQWLAFFLEDDEEYAKLRSEYAAGRVLSGDVKTKLVKLLQEVVKTHKEARKAITDEQLKQWMSPRPMRETIDKMAADNASRAAAVAKPAE